MTKRKILAVTPGSHAGALVDAAAKLAFPKAECVHLKSVDDLVARPACPPQAGPDAEVAVLEDPGPRELAAITAVVDDEGLRRWPVVVIGEDWAAEWAEVVSPNTDSRLLAYAIKTAVAKHRLERECAQARGDLWTMGRRITHDLRAPLGCILTAGEALVESLDPGDPARNSLAVPIVDSAAELSRLIERVSFVAKASAGKTPREKVDMGAGLDLAIERLQSMIAEKKAVVSRPDEWPTVRAVSTWVDAIWENLLLNALQHGGPAPEVTAAFRQDGDEWRFSVCDKGSGVPPGRVPHLFQAFHRLHEYEVAYGLGLPIVRRLVELLGGRVGYDPGAGQGSCFYFTLPRDEQRSAHPKSPRTR